jgi:GT2 family glycosyltransferase
MIPSGTLFGSSPESFETCAVSPDLDPAAITTVICVPTYRRPELLARTLASLAGQAGVGDQVGLRQVAVIIVDNDGEGRAGAAVATEWLMGGRLAGIAIVEPQQGNCNAYNAAWRCALTRFANARFICGIDDDETADPDWLARMAAGAEGSGAGIVGGSVVPEFEDPAAVRYRLHPVFRSHYGETGPVPIIYSSANYLIRRDVIEASGYPFLDPAFNFMGGGDTDFFTRAKARGVRFHWQQDARMGEIMPARRTQWDWISARSYRNGMISALIERKADASLAGHARRLARSFALVAASPIRSALLGAQTRSFRIGLYHMQVAAGRIMAEFGLTIEQYRAPEKN